MKSEKAIKNAIKETVNEDDYDRGFHAALDWVLEKEEVE